MLTKQYIFFKKYEIFCIILWDSAFLSFNYVKVPGIWYYLIIFFLVPAWPWFQNG